MAAATINCTREVSWRYCRDGISGVNISLDRRIVWWRNWLKKKYLLTLAQTSWLLRTFAEGFPKTFMIQAVMQLSHFLAIAPITFFQFTALG